MSSIKKVVKKVANVATLGQADKLKEVFFDKPLELVQGAVGAVTGQPMGGAQQEVKAEAKTKDKPEAPIQDDEAKRLAKMKDLKRRTAEPGGGGGRASTVLTGGSSLG